MDFQHPKEKAGKLPKTVQGTFISTVSKSKLGDQTTKKSGLLGKKKSLKPADSEKLDKKSASKKKG